MAFQSFQSPQANPSSLLGLFQNFVSTPSEGDSAAKESTGTNANTPRLGFRFSMGPETVTITEVSPQSSASVVGLRRGDVIVAASQTGQSFIPVSRRGNQEMDVHVFKSQPIAEAKQRTPRRIDDGGAGGETSTNPPEFIRSASSPTSQGVAYSPHQPSQGVHMHPHAHPALSSAPSPASNWGISGNTSSTNPFSSTPLGALSTPDKTTALASPSQPPFAGGGGGGPPPVHVTGMSSAPNRGGVLSPRQDGYRVPVIVNHQGGQISSEIMAQAGTMGHAYRNWSSPSGAADGDVSWGLRGHLAATAPAPAAPAAVLTPPTNHPAHRPATPAASTATGTSHSPATPAAAGTIGARGIVPAAALASAPPAFAQGGGSVAAAAAAATGAAVTGAGGDEMSAAAGGPRHDAAAEGRGRAGGDGDGGEATRRPRGREGEVGRREGDGGGGGDRGRAEGARERAREKEMMGRLEEQVDRIKARHYAGGGAADRRYVGGGGGGEGGPGRETRDQVVAALRLQVQQVQEALRQERRRNDQLSHALQQASDDAAEGESLRAAVVDKDRELEAMRRELLSAVGEREAAHRRLREAEARFARMESKSADFKGSPGEGQGQAEAAKPLETSQDSPWSNSKKILEEAVSSLQQQLGCAVSEIGSLQSRLEQRGAGSDYSKQDLMCALEEGAGAIANLKATISSLQSQLKSEQERASKCLARTEELEKELATEKETSATVRQALLDAGGLAVQLQEAQQQLESAVYERRKWEHKYRKLQQDFEQCRAKVKELERGAGDKNEVMREDLELKRHAFQEQEMTLVSVMRDAGAAVASKNSQERLLLEVMSGVIIKFIQSVEIDRIAGEMQAVKEASIEAQRVKEAMDGQREIEEQLEFQYSIVTDLTMEHRRLNEIVMEARKAAVAVRPKGIVPIRLMGALDTSPGGVMRTAAAQGRFGSTLRENEYHAARLAQLLRDPSFHPFTTDVSRPNRPQQVVSRNDPRLEEVRRAYGSRVADDVVRAVSELNTWNASGRYPMEVPWNREEDKELTAGEVISILAAELAPLHMRMVHGGRHP